MSSLLAIMILGQCNAYRGAAVYAAPSYAAQSYSYSYAQPYNYHQEYFSYTPYAAAMVGDRLKAEEAQEKQLKLLATLTETVARLQQPVAALQPVYQPPSPVQVPYPPQPVAKSPPPAIPPQPLVVPFPSPQQPLQAPAKPTPVPSPPVPSPQEPLPPPAPNIQTPPASTPKSAPIQGGYPLDSTVQVDSMARVVLQTYCAACHTGATARNGFQIFTAPNQLAGLTPVDMMKIELKVRTGQMPPPDRAQVPDDDLRVLQAWVNNASSGLEMALDSMRRPQKTQ